jgi:hypothetical protein
VSDPLTLLGHLADPPRLRIFAALVLAPRTAAEAGEVAGVAPKDVLKALTRLEDAGLVRRQGEQWAAVEERLRAVVATAMPERKVVDHGAADPEEAAVLRAFLPEGHLESIPATRSKRLVVLNHICRVFEPGYRYGEPEVNALLRAFHPDVAALRRYLVDEGYLSREAGVYWRSGGTVEL